MNVISGRVVLKETGIGIPGLLVVVTSVDTAAPATRARLVVAERLGSQITGVDGTFRIEFDDAAFQVRNAEEKRPNLSLSVLAPDEPGLAAKTGVLYVSSEIRTGAGRSEQYLVRIPGTVLDKAGVSRPTDPAAVSPGDHVVGRMQQALATTLGIQQEATALAAKQVAEVRAKAKAVDTEIESRLVESLTGLSAKDAESLNVVLPGSNPQPFIWKTVQKGIENVVNAKAPLSGYIVLDEKDTKQFEDGHGHYRSDVPAAEIEPYLYQADSEADRTTFLVRTDPTVAACRNGAPSDPFASGTGASSGGADGTPSGGGTTPPAPPQDLPAFVKNLVSPIVPPEDASIFEPQTRPGENDVQASVEALSLRSGPADVPAFYDFHQLQIAFDYVWQQAVDDGVIATGKALARSLIERGGDPLGAVRAGGDPIAALREETTHVTTAGATLEIADVPTSLARKSTNGSTNGGHSVDPPIHFPPVTRPPFTGTGPTATAGSSAGGGSTSAEPGDLLAELTDLLNERYKFEVFAPGSTNFGLLVTYRQQWKPITYQAGPLVKTMTLAPKEVRKVSTKQTTKRSRSYKETQSHQQIRKDDTNQTMRDQAEIVQRAQDKTSFNVNAKGSYNILLSKGEATTTFGRDAQSASQDTKKAFRESVIKAAQEMKDERKVEVETKASTEATVTDSSEISNPNDELTVTYLFYELQRRFRISESIHRLTPVVLVGMEVPNPSRDAIDKVLLAHSWIIDRVLLDDRYRPALDYLCKRVVGDQLALQAHAANLARVQEAVNAIKALHKNVEGMLAGRELALENAIKNRSNDIAKKDTQGWLQGAWESVAGGGDSTDVEAARVVEQAAQDAYDRAVREEKDLRMRLEAETAALNAASDAYSRAYAEHANHLLEIAGLRAHFKENVLYYMQAIWTFTFEDQIFFSLSTVKVPRLKAAKKVYAVSVPDTVPPGVVPKSGQVVLEVKADVKLDTSMDPATDYVTLAEIADLDTPLGFKGNYMIFPLRKSNPLTDFMMVPYLDTELGLRDPDHLGSWTPEDFVSYARCVLAGEKDKLSAADYEKLKNELEAQYQQIVSNPRPSTDDIVVSTGSLFIEALPGTHPLLEDFKLAHRIIDVKKAQGEARKVELENLRYAARILGNELDDPEVDRKVIIDGVSSVVVPPGG